MASTVSVASEDAVSLDAAGLAVTGPDDITTIGAVASVDTAVPGIDDDISITGQESVLSLPVVDSACDVLKTKEWLEGQLYDQLSHMGTDKVDVPPTKDIEVARGRLSQLQTELLNTSSKMSAKEITLKRLQLGSALSKELFGPDDTGGGNEERRKELEDLVLTQRKLVSDILKAGEGLEALRTELNTLRQKNFEMKGKNRKSMHQVRQRQNILEEKADDFRKNKDGQRKKEQLEDEIKKIVILRHTLQGLILGSGINWAEDPAMEEFLLSLGEPLNF